MLQQSTNAPSAPVNPSHLPKGMEGMASPGVDIQKAERTKVLEQLLGLNTQDGKMDTKEKNVYTELSHSYNVPGKFTAIIDAFVKTEQGKDYATKKQDFQNILVESFQNLSQQSEQQREAVLYGAQSRLQSLKESINAEKKAPPKAEHKRRVPDGKKVFESYEESKDLVAVTENTNYTVEERGGALVLTPVQKKGGDWMGRIDGSTFAAGAGFLIFSASAISSIGGDANEQTIMLASGALLSGNYLKNTLSGESVPGGSKVQDLAEKYQVEESFVAGMVENHRAYTARFGKHTLDMPGAEYSKSVRDINWQLFDALKGENLHNALKNAQVNGKCWDPDNPFTTEEKIAWLEDFFKKNGSENPSFMEKIKDKTEYGKIVDQNPKILDNFYDVLWYLDDRGVHSETRKNAFVAVGNAIDDSLDKGVFKKLFHLDMLA